MFNGILFQESLQDLVKGIRSHRRDEAAYIREKIAEISKECRSSDMTKKTTAVLKLAQLQMMGYNASFAAFHIVEVMSAPDFASKRVGYFAAAQSFSPTTDVLLLTTNQFKKDLTNGRIQDCSQALTCLGKLVNESLACDLGPDVALLLSSPRPYIRKKTLLVLYRLIVVYPDTLHAVSSKFVSCLSDPDPGVVCAAVTVTCELARGAPRTFLELAPVLYQLLTTSNNNWMLIKIVKLMGVLTPLEPRLGKKLVGPLTNLMRTTRAKSLLYECCSTVTEGLLDQEELVKLCGDRLSEFMVDPDQNLKYLGLLSMRKLVKAHPQIAMQHRDLILDCLDDVDIGIRMRALELVAEFVTRRTLRDISRILLRKLRASSGALTGVPSGTLLYQSSDLGVVDGRADSMNATAIPEIQAPVSDLLLDPEIPYREALAEQLLTPGHYQRGDGYPILSSEDDFVWYIATVHGGLARTQGLSRRIAQIVGSQLIELISRVEAIRPATVLIAVALLKSGLPKEAKNNIRADKLTDFSKGCTALGDTDGGLSHPDAAGVVSAATVCASTASKRGDTAIDLNGDMLISSAPYSPVTADDTRNTDIVSNNEQVLHSEVVAAAAWVIGEYAEFHEDFMGAANVLMQYPTCHIDGRAQVALMSALMKLFAACGPQEAAEIYPHVIRHLEMCLESELAEVCERAWMFRKLVEQAGAGCNKDLSALFKKKLLPVDHRAQRQVQVPEGLDIHSSFLDTPGMSLRAYLADGDESYVSDAMGLDGEDDDDDDLFSQLRNGASRLNTNGSGFTDAPDRSNSSGVGARDIFYLGNDSSSQVVSGLSPNHEDKKGFSDEANLVDHDSLLGFAKSRLGPLSLAAGPVAVFTGDVPVGIIVSEDDETRRISRARTRDTHVVKDDRLDTAFEGAFSTGNPTIESGKSKRRRKKKSRSKETANLESSLNLIDFGDPFASPSAAAASDTTRAAPKHMGPQSDLLS